MEKFLCIKINRKSIIIIIFTVNVLTIYVNIILLDSGDNIKKYLFLDESGDLGYNGSKYFVLVILEVKSHNESKKLDKSIKKLKKSRFKKELQNMSEIKGTQISDKLRFKIIDILANQNIKIYALVLNKQNTNFKNFLFANGVNNTYMQLVGKLISKMNIKDPIDLKLDNFVPKSQKNLFKLILLDIIDENKKFSNISFFSSENLRGIQTADVIAWSIFQFFENENEIFIEKISSKIYLKIIRL